MHRRSLSWVDPDSISDTQALMCIHGASGARFSGKISPSTHLWTCALSVPHLVALGASRTIALPWDRETTRDSIRNVIVLGQCQWQCRFSASGRRTLGQLSRRCPRSVHRVHRIPRPCHHDRQLRISMCQGGAFVGSLYAELVVTMVAHFWAVTLAMPVLVAQGASHPLALQTLETEQVSSG